MTIFHKPGVRKQLIIGAVVCAVIIGAGFIWWRSRLVEPHVVGGVAAVNLKQIGAASAQGGSREHQVSSDLVSIKKGGGYHYYSPLTDPPPHATPEQLKVWSKQYRKKLYGDMVPNIGPNSPPLASIYQAETEKAMQGDTSAAMTLFKGLRYCTGIYSQLDIGLSETKTRELAAYCKGVTSRQKDNWVYWGWQAAQAGNPVAESLMATGAASQTMVGAKNVREYRAVLRTMNDKAAQAGVLQAWDTMIGAYSGGGLGYPVSRVNSYASLYTAYMLTRSPYLEMAVWRRSLRFTPLEIAEAVERGRKNYQETIR